MSDLLFQTSLFAEQIFLLALVSAGLFFFLTALLLAYRTKNVRAESLYYFGYALACFFLFKNVAVFPTTVKIDPYDGTTMTFIERNFLSLTNRETKLYLRWDNELKAQVWMSKNGDKYHRFFYEKE